jgi:hypothetical protein
MKQLLTTLILSALLAGGAQADEITWRGANGEPAVDTDSRKSANGFGGWVASTSDADWLERWERPANGTPSLTESKSVRRGEKLTILIFVLNAAPDAQNQANVRCDLRVTRPDGSHPVDAADVTCLQGEVKGEPGAIRIAGPIINFVGEPTDQVGTWTVDVSLKDAVRNTTLALKTTFELKE